MRVHCFDVKVAIELGQRAATLLYNIDFWIQKNRANGKHYHKGRYWTYNSVKAFAELHPYYTSRVIENELKALIEKGYLVKDFLSEDKRDRTAWYALTDKYYRLIGNSDMQETQKGEIVFTEIGESHSPNRESPFTEMGKCIISNTDINTNNYKADMRKENARASENHTQGLLSLECKAESANAPFAFFTPDLFLPTDSVTPDDLAFLNATYGKILANNDWAKGFARELGLFALYRKTNKKAGILSDRAMGLLLGRLKGFKGLESIKNALMDSIINNWAGVFEKSPYNANAMDRETLKRASQPNADLIVDFDRDLYVVKAYLNNNQPIPPELMATYEKLKRDKKI